MSIGTSTSRSIPFVVEHIQRLQPLSIFDAGCGWGRWGFLAREYLEFWEHRFDRAEWKTYICGLDINEGNWTPVQTYVYDTLITADLRRWRPDQTYDLVIATDVLEHIPKDDAWEIVSKFRRNCRHLIVGVPLGSGWARGGHPDNPHEAHVSEWSWQDFSQDAQDWAAVMTEDPLPYGIFLL